MNGSLVNGFKQHTESPAVPASERPGPWGSVLSKGWVLGSRNASQQGASALPVSQHLPGPCPGVPVPQAPTGDFAFAE